MTESPSLSSQELRSLLVETGAMLEGHFLLSSGLHSDRYMQCALLLSHPRHAFRLGAALARALPDAARTWSSPRPWAASSSGRRRRPPWTCAPISRSARAAR